MRKVNSNLKRVSTKRKTAPAGRVTKVFLELHGAGGRDRIG